MTVADEQDASINDDSRCYLGVREAGGRRIAVGGAFCGPVLVLGSAPGDIWVRVDVRPTDGDGRVLGVAPMSRAFAGSVDGQTVVVFVAKEGPYQGRVLSAVVPDANQMARWGLS